MINALSIDLEDWYHPELIKAFINTATKSAQIEEAVSPIMDLLDRYNVKATFFVLGEVARANPQLIKKIYSKGHEIASHGMNHVPLWRLNRENFAKQLDDFQALVREIVGGNITIKGFRAPSFSLDESTSWALEVLKEKGYKYDSSIFPFKNKLYGVNGAPLKIYEPSVSDIRLNSRGGGFMEFPLAVYEFCGIRIPVSGGAYFRFMPLFLIKMLLKRINKTRPFVFYLHPWESCRLTPRVKGISGSNYLITYWGIPGVLNKFEKLLNAFSFKPVCEVLGV